MKLSEMIRIAEPATGKELVQRQKQEKDAAKKARQTATKLVTSMSKTQQLLSDALENMRENADELDNLRSQAYNLLSPDLIKKITDEVRKLEKLAKKGSGDLVNVAVAFSDVSHGSVSQIPIYLNEHVIYRK